MLTQNVKNDDLLKEIITVNGKQITVAEALSKGGVIVIDKVLTANPDYTQLFIAGNVKTESSSSVTKAQAFLLGWGDESTFLARLIVNAKTAVADQFKIGEIMSDFAVRVVDTTIPAWTREDGSCQAPRVDRNGNTYTHGGLPVYRNYQFVTLDELEQVGHQILKRDGVSIAHTSKAVATAAILETEVVEAEHVN